MKELSSEADQKNSSGWNYNLILSEEEDIQSQRNCCSEISGYLHKCLRDPGSICPPDLLPAEQDNLITSAPLRHTPEIHTNSPLNV